MDEAWMEFVPGKKKRDEQIVLISLAKVFGF
jgi:hypothetical protein